MGDPLELVFPVEPLTSEICPCSVLMNGPLSPIDPLFPVESLTPDMLSCSVLMGGRLSPIKPLFPIALCHMTFYLALY